MEHLALCCHVPVHILRRSNMYKDGDHTHFGMIIGESDSGEWNVPAMWDRLDKELDIPSRRALVDDFNSQHKWLKRGLSMIPTKFGIAFTAKYMNQGGALVHLYTDGTVLVSHGGTEMGQGLHSVSKSDWQIRRCMLKTHDRSHLLVSQKVCQVAAQAFGIQIEDVYVNDSSTDKVSQG
jgi:xanthine dehydrogenase/oxidase